MTTAPELGTATLTVAADDRDRKLALLRAVGLDRLAPDQRELALNIATRYELDLLLKHLVMIEGRPYITRDGLLHVAHRSGQLDGIETTEPEVREGYWRATCAVYRKDMRHPFTYFGRYPTTGGNQKFAPEMAVKVAEVMALRRAFDVSAPTAEERWDVPDAPVEPATTPTLAERVAARRPKPPEPPEDAPRSEVTVEVAAEATPAAVAVAKAACGDEDASPMGLGICASPKGHKDAHRSEHGTWPR